MFERGTFERGMFERIHFRADVQASLIRTNQCSSEACSSKAWSGKEEWYEKCISCILNLINRTWNNLNSEKVNVKRGENQKAKMTSNLF